MRSGSSCKCAKIMSDVFFVGVRASELFWRQMNDKQLESIYIQSHLYFTPIYIHSLMHAFSLYHLLPYSENYPISFKQLLICYPLNNTHYRVKLSSP